MNNASTKQLFTFNWTFFGFIWQPYWKGVSTWVSLGGPCGHGIPRCGCPGGLEWSVAPEWAWPCYSHRMAEKGPPWHISRQEPSCSGLKVLPVLLLLGNCNSSVRVDTTPAHPLPHTQSPKCCC